MSMIQIQNLTFGYDGSAANVFENVSLRLDTDWKLGLTGRNGRGKTTFLKLLAGSYEYRGTISATVNFVYFPFPVREKDRLALEILQEICPAAQDWELIRELSYLNVGAEKLYMPFGLLSGGEQTKLLLAALFLTEKAFRCSTSRPTIWTPPHAKPSPTISTVKAAISSSRTTGRF